MRNTRAPPQLHVQGRFREHAVGPSRCQKQEHAVMRRDRLSTRASRLYIRPELFLQCSCGGEAACVVLLVCHPSSFKRRADSDVIRCGSRGTACVQLYRESHRAGMAPCLLVAPEIPDRNLASDVVAQPQRELSRPRHRDDQHCHRTVRLLLRPHLPRLARVILRQPISLLM